MRTIYWWPLSTCATNLRRGEKQNWNRDFGGKVDQVGEAGQSRALPGHLCWICIFCTFVFLLLCWICIFCSFIFLLLCWICIFCSFVFLLLCWICIFCSFVFLLLCWICIFCTFVFLLLCWICIFLYLCFYSSKGSLRIYISCVVLVVFIFIAG